jgi:hypothetical protein
MISILLLASAIGSFSDLGYVNMLLLQGRITLPQGGVGGVTFKADSALTNRSFSHSSTPLFGPQVSHAARQSTTRYTPKTPQLINSRQVANEAVRQSVYGRRWGW